MTKEAALKLLKDSFVMDIKEKTSEVQEAIVIAMDALEKSMPVEVTPYASSCDPSDMDIIDCPKCGETYWSEDWGTLNYCPNCGQAIKVKEE